MANKGREMTSCLRNLSEVKLGELMLQFGFLKVIAVSQSDIT